MSVSNDKGGGAEERALRHSSWPWILVVAAGVVAGLWCVSAPDEPIDTGRLRVEVVARHPHDRQAFTQGLLWHDGKLYESTGRYGHSSLRRVHLDTGRVEQQVDLESEIFAEGLARVNDQLIQLSWREGRAIVWNLSTFERVREHEYPGEGWGLCYDGSRLIMSSGNDRLVFRDPGTFQKIGEVTVTEDGRPVRNLNELECVGDVVYANVWMRETIVRIDPSNGEVTASIDAQGLLPREDRQGGEDVMNGIAYLPERDHFLVTGKNWPYTYEVEFVPAEPEEPPSETD